MAVWIETVPYYHSVSDKKEYHVGKNPDRFMCARGKTIVAEHLAEGLPKKDPGEQDPVLCPLCRKERSKMLDAQVDEVRRRK